MDKLFSNFLVSSPNGGGLLSIQAGETRKLDSLDTTGLAIRGQRVVRGIQPSLVVVYGERSIDIQGVNVQFDDIHDVLIDDDCFFLVSTIANTIIKLDSAGNVSKRWTFPGEEDSWHINSLTKWQGRLVFSAFGEFQEHRGYKGHSRQAGGVYDLETGRKLIGGLSQPHSLTVHGENLLLANSELQELAEYSPGGEKLRSLDIGGYTRGICVDGDNIFIGLSCSRNKPDTHLDDASLVALDRESWGEISRLRLPVREIYDVVKVSESDLPKVVAKISEHTSATLGKIILMRENSLSEKDKEISRIQAELSVKLDVENAIREVTQRQSLQTSSFVEEFRGFFDSTTSRFDRVENYVSKIDSLEDSRRLLVVIQGQINERLLESQNELTALQNAISSERVENSRLTMLLEQCRQEKQIKESADAQTILAFREKIEAMNEAALAVDIANMNALSDVQVENARPMISIDQCNQEMQQKMYADGQTILALREKIDAISEAASVAEAVNRDAIALNEALAKQLDAVNDESERMKISLCGYETQQRELERLSAGDQARISALEEELALIKNSHSMRVTKPIRHARRATESVARHVAAPINGLLYFAAQPNRLVPYLRHSREIGLKRTLLHFFKFMSRGGPDLNAASATSTAGPEVRFNLRLEEGKKVVILTTKHCEYIASLMRIALTKVGIDSEVIFKKPEAGYSDAPHFVICPQIFDEMPGFYVSYQMEQSVSSRWFTDSYIKRLENSYAIFDYSTVNISYLHGCGLSLKQIYYLPVGQIPDLSRDETECHEYDVVFYGDSNCERRLFFLNELKKHFSVLVVKETFGDDLYALLKSARVVVNIHYYKGALLETTRLWECISLGHLVVSERSVDMEAQDDLLDLVDFVDIDDVDGMVNRVRYWLDDDLRREKKKSNDLRIREKSNRFDYFFYRFLLATDNITFEEFWKHSGKYYVLPTNKLCLNLPEYVERREDFDADNRYGFHVFPGLRHTKGWVGCAMSYKYMLRLCKENLMERAIICEDDVEFPEDFSSSWESIEKSIDTVVEDWDIFSGLMADLHADANIIDVVDGGKFDFVVTDRLISTVFNCYNRKVFDVVVAWDESDRRMESNTIDRYLEKNTALRVVTTSPFLVGHKEEQHSTIWGFKNTQYSTLIQASSKLLKDKVKRYKLRTSILRRIGVVNRG
jgi:hypothetical protein